ncbi:hypothetical protein B0H14DRAFT_2864235 [Mycena olivaceomarginata]|nr:hypothetical protein B0H14DRAFT_2864235 [Mycena olivaceomarginata]
MPVQLPAVPGVLQDRLNVQIVTPQDLPTSVDQATIAESGKDISIEALGAITAYDEQGVTLTIDNIRRILRAELDNKLSPIEARINKKLDAMKTDLERTLGKMTALAASLIILTAILTRNAQLGSGKVTPFENVTFPDGTLPYYCKYTGKTGNLPSEAEQLDGIRRAFGRTVPIA